MKKLLQWCNCNFPCCCCDVEVSSRVWSVHHDITVMCARCGNRAHLWPHTRCWAQSEVKQTRNFYPKRAVGEKKTYQPCLFKDTWIKCFSQLFIRYFVSAVLWPGLSCKLGTDLQDVLICRVQLRDITPRGTGYHRECSGQPGFPQWQAQDHGYA